MMPKFLNMYHMPEYCHYSWAYYKNNDKNKPTEQVPTRRVKRLPASAQRYCRRGRLARRRADV